jgi:hypothetical protein
LPLPITAAWLPSSGGAKSAKSGWPSIPTDKFGRPYDSGQVFAGNSELPVVRRPDRQDHCIVKPLELVGGNVASDADIPDKSDLFAFRDLIICASTRPSVTGDPAPLQSE